MQDGSGAMKASELLRCQALDGIEAARRLNQQGDKVNAGAEIQRAWDLLAEALGLCPSNHKARFLLVSCAMNAEDFQRAKTEAMFIYEHMTEAQKRGLGDSVLHLSIAHACKMLGELREAIHFAKEASSLYECDPQPHLILGELLEAHDELGPAERSCEQALKLNEDPACKHPLTQHNVVFALSCLGSSIMKQGRYAEAETILRRACELDSEATPAMRHLVDILVAQNRLQEALHFAQRVQTLEPEDTEVQRHIVEIQRTLDQRRSDSVVVQPASGRKDLHDTARSGGNSGRYRRANAPNAESKKDLKAKDLVKEGVRREDELGTHSVMVPPPAADKKHVTEDSFSEDTEGTSPLSSRANRYQKQGKQKDDGDAGGIFFCCLGDRS